ncbi:MAG TPA: nuclear transport factor 2 family protein [Candidatus Polarisedimenticolia bacterium]|nr:nuclear transport factor 2 family protein [Candidatus Polarisedimenticolia bacterium]
MRIELATLTLSVLVLASCSAPAPAAAPAEAFNPEDPAVTATLDSMVALARDGANAADADRALAALNAVEDFTFMSGKLILTGKEHILGAFRDTYAQVHRQAYAPIGHKVQLIAPDVAIYSALGRGSFQDKDGNVSDPVHIGASMVFMRRDGVWRAVHLHQTVQP